MAWSGAARRGVVRSPRLAPAAGGRLTSLSSVQFGRLRLAAQLCAVAETRLLCRLVALGRRECKESTLVTRVT